jgi:hypothetical protein
MYIEGERQGMLIEFRRGSILTGVPVGKPRMGLEYIVKRGLKFRGGSWMKLAVDGIESS